MQQLRLATLHTRDLGNPFSRLLTTALGMMVVLTILATVLLIVVPVLGVILSAAVGGVILAIAGIMLMTPLFLIAGTVVAFVSRGHSGRTRR